MSRVLLLGVAAAALTACGGAVDYDPAKAGAVAAAAVAAGDCRAKGVYRYALDTPGLPQPDGELRERLGVDVIEGTSDAPRNAEEQRFNERAAKYAEAYNRRLADFVRAGRCGS